MSRYLEIKDDAREDILSAFLWYEEQQDGLGERFMSDLDLTFDYLCSRPQSFQTVHRKFHQLPLHRFPFVIIYKFDEQTISVYRVFHTSRNPRGWKV